MSDELKQGRKLGNNELILRIGRGGMATVWVARERGGRSAREDRLVAVKAMLTELADEPEFVRMFIDEVRLVRSIRHPNVVTVYDVGEDDGVMWMSMEWVEGESLHAVIAEAGKRRAIPPEMAVRIIADLASGVHAAHEVRDPDGALRGVVHRDISPHNILIGTNGVVKLVDFGVAKALGRVSDATRVGQLKGKFGYMSPEQARGMPIDRRSDIFSLGIVLYELTTSRRLFRGDSDVETLRFVMTADVPRPSSVDPDYPSDLEAIVMRALRSDPSERYQTAQALAADLNAFLKARHTVVAQSGVAALLKRIVGTRVEQRRRALRGVLKTLVREGALEPDLLSADPAFTPTGKGPERGSSSGVTGTNASEPRAGLLTTELSHPNRPAYPNELQASSMGRPGRPEGDGRARKTKTSWARVLGYAIGLAGLAIALIVLLLLGR